MEKSSTEEREQKRYNVPLCVTSEFTEKGKLLIEHMSIIDLSSVDAHLKALRAVEAGTAMELEIVDCDSGFVNQFGAWSKIHGDLVNLKVQAEVQRCDPFPGDEKHWQITVKFRKPIHLYGY